MNDGFFYYGKVVQRRLPVILLISLALSLAAFAVMRNIKPTYEVHFSYLVSLSEREAAPDFRFDGFYALQATDLFAATLARWLAAPEVAQAAYAAAQIEDVPQNPRELVRAVRAEKTAPQLVQVTVEGEKRDEVERLSAALQDVMKQNIVMYHDQGVPAARFSAVPTESWTGTVKPSVAVVTIGVFVFTFFIMINVVLLAETIRNSSGGP